MDAGAIAGLGKEAEAQSFGKIANIGKLIYGLHQANQGNKALKRLDAERSFYARRTDPNILYNQQLAESGASQGFSNSTKNMYTDNVNRALGTGINAILSGGGDVNMISSLVNGVLPSYRQMMIEDANLKQQKQATLMNANQQVAAENEANWDVNIHTPYLQKYYGAVQQTNSGAENAMSGLQGIAGQANASSVNGIDYNSLIAGLSSNKSNSYGNGGFASPTYGGASGYGNYGGASVYGDNLMS